MKALLSCPFNSISDRPASHRSSQGVIYADMIRELGVDLDINFGGKIRGYNRYKTLYVYHGNDWFGSLNLFGGLQSYANVANIRAFSQFKGQVISLGCDFPPYHDMLSKRILKAKETNKEIQPEWLEVDMENLRQMHVHAPTVKFPNITDKLVIGDSHSICMYRPGWTINSVPFKTLNGALNTGLETFITEVCPLDNVKSLECYFGNIDIRHHLCRIEGDSIQNAILLAQRYVMAAEALPIKDISIYELLPLEHESRKLPGTGYYKGRPFWGSWQNRNAVRHAFNETVKNSVARVKFIEWTKYLLNSKGELDFAYMEKPQSIHLSREFYPHWRPKIDLAPQPLPAIDNSIDYKNNTLENFFTV